LNFIQRDSGCILWISNRRWCRDYWITWNILAKGGILRVWLGPKLLLN